ncbi:hypothetical protein ASF66_13750 [Pseudomonas sp. Leaf129]|uniref:fimbria/pilus outer membrane usher protein n=1 Tax=Pseudomonas sp. Leaf129 TaxID=1736268 RepID=UPI0007036A7B|nr:fimbria/pilus outer membrane usher protein [Pseudomonas sp. Leaf129]KQQ60797.1 hypothetical protein ASF66_13750 [Pseudomonas sp. Leaf129]
MRLPAQLYRGLTARTVQACLLSTCWLLSPMSARSDEKLIFNPYSLDARGGGVAADLEVFSRGQQLPGEYPVDIYLNRIRVANRSVTFVMEDSVLRAQLTVQELTDMGVNTAAFAPLAALSPQAIVTDLGRYIPQASTRFDFAHQRLDVLVPQASLRFDARNAVDPSRWDQGLPAFVMNYNLTAARSSYDGGGDANNAFLNLGTGVNLGAWRLRNNSTYTYTRNSATRRLYSDDEYDDEFNDAMTRQGSRRSWQSINTYAQRDIQRLGGQLTLGEGTTSGTVFDTIQYRGAQLASDDSMLPDSQRGFAPVVRGIANSSAQITVRQNGYVIYQTYVAPGPYVIRDLYATGGSGDLQVTVREEGGNERTYIQPYSSVPLMQRDGRLRYEFTGGQYRSSYGDAREPGFGQASLAYGISNTTTVYGGLTGSPDYASGLFGVGQGLGRLGSVSFDVTQANTRLQDGSRHQGQSYRVQYAKDVFQSGTTFTLAGYRYSTSGFYDFNEANEIVPDVMDRWRWGYNKRSRTQVQISQSLGEYGSLYVNAYQQDYWGLSGTERNLSAGYNVSFTNGVNLGLSTTSSFTPGGRGSDQHYVLSVQIPLSFMGSSWATLSTQTDSRNRTSQSATVSGQALEDNNLNYAVRQSVGNQGMGKGGGANVTYKGTYGNVQAGYSYTDDSQQYTAGVQGGVIAHPYGVTLSQPLSETVALVKAAGASGVRVQNQPGVKTDWRGYAVVPYATTYRENRVGLSPDSLSEDVDIPETVKTVVPTRGAVVLADFQTRVGSRVLVTLRNENEFVPFGASASLFGRNPDTGAEEEIGGGIVGGQGELYLSGVPDESQVRVRVRWGSEADQLCTAKLTLAGAETTGPVKVLGADCNTR